MNLNQLNSLETISKSFNIHLGFLQSIHNNIQDKKYIEFFNSLYGDVLKQGKASKRKVVAHILCSPEKKKCPDGTYVRRILPNCDFQKCP